MAFRRYKPYILCRKKDDDLSIVLNQLTLKDKQIEEGKNKLEEAEKKTLVFKELLIEDSEQPCQQIIYIATSVNYAKQNRFKVGGVRTKELLKKRLSCYNCRSASGDEWYISDIFNVPNFRQVETRLKDIAGRFRDKQSKEIYVMHYTVLKELVITITKNYVLENDFMNKNMTSCIELLNPSCSVVPSVFLQ